MTDTIVDDITKLTINSEEKKLNITDEKKLNIAILGYKVALLPPWDPNTTETGLPGSEECAVYASDELARRGHKVTVYMNPPTDSKFRFPESNPRWVSVDEWTNKIETGKDNDAKYDLVLMWRRGDLATGKERGTYVFFWPHDSPGMVQPNMIFPPFDGICILSKHHHRQYCAFSSFANIPYIVCGNGLVPEQFAKPCQFTNPFSIGYFSNYSRGLFLLIMFWPEIRKEFPTATLAICYGRETWNTMQPEQLKYLCAKIEEYKTQGVTEHGKVGHLQLAKIMCETSIWAYPCNTESETFCITAVKCCAAGMIPVTTQIGALLETVHPDAPHMEPITNNAGAHKYKDLLLTTLKRVKDTPAEEMRTERQKYIDFGLSFSWKCCIDRWLQLYNTVAK